MRRSEWNAKAGGYAYTKSQTEDGGFARLSMLASWVGDPARRLVVAFRQGVSSRRPGSRGTIVMSVHDLNATSGLDTSVKRSPRRCAVTLSKSCVVAEESLRVLAARRPIVSASTWRRPRA